MRRLLPILVLLVVAGSAAACDASFTPYAAKVDGTTISQGSVKSDLDAIAANPALSCFVKQNSAISGAGAGTYSAAFTASRLSSEINSEVVTAELARRNLTVSSLATTFAKSEFVGELQPASGSTCTISGNDAVASFGPELTKSLVDSQAASDSLSAALGGYPLTTTGVAAFTAAHPSESSSQCVSDIVVKTKAAATQVASAIADGASFASVAKASSVDQSNASNGGANPCGPADYFPSPLNTAIINLPLNTASSILSYDGYFVLVEVTSRTPSQNIAIEALVAKGDTAESKLVTSLLNHATVEVNPAYGTWKKVSGTDQVTTNDGPPTKLLGNVPAISPVTP